jgi:hypothetical protein
MITSIFVSTSRELLNRSIGTQRFPTFRSIKNEPLSPAPLLAPSSTGTLRR